MRGTVRSLAISLAVLLAAAAAMAPQTALAQPIPSYAQAPSGNVQAHSGQETISGRVSLVQGEYMEISDDRGFTDRVDFTTDTVMRPAGVSLRAGIRVRVVGYNEGQIFDAYEIDAGNGGNSAPTYGYNPQPPTAYNPPPPAPDYGSQPSDGYNAQPAMPVPAMPSQVADAPPAQMQQLPPYATPIAAQPVYAQPVYVPYAVPYPVYAYPAPPPYAFYPRFYVRFGGRFR